MITPLHIAFAILEGVILAHILIGSKTAQIACLILIAYLFIMSIIDPIVPAYIN